MSRASRGAGAVLLALLLVGVLAVPAASGTALGAQQSDENNSTANASGPYDLETLERGGQLPDGAPPSTRAMGSSTTLWVEYAPTGFMRSSDDRADLTRGTTVRRNTVWLRSSRAWDAEPRDVEVVLVYYKVEDVQRTTEDGETYSERQAVNQTVDRLDVTLSSGYDTTEIDLREVEGDDELQVAMFVEGQDGVRWSFNQVTTPAAQDVAINSLGDAVAWAMLWVFSPFLVVLLLVLWIDQKVLKIAGAGPQYRTSEYVGVAFFAAFFALLFAYNPIIDLIARAPWLVGVFSGLGFALLVVEMFGDDTYRDLFLRFDLEDVETREDGSGIQQVEVVEKKLVDLADGRTGVVEDGLKPFAARARGAIPALDTGPLRRETQLDVQGKWRNLHLVDPTADAALEYEPAEWELDVVEWDREVDEESPSWLSAIPSVEVLPVMIGLGVVYACYSLSEMFLGSGVIGMLGSGAVVLMLWASPVAGVARTKLAPMHFDAVISNVLTMAEGLEEAADRDYFRKKYHQEQGRNLSKRKAEREDSEQTRMEMVMDRLAPNVDDEQDADVDVENGPDAGGSNE